MTENKEERPEELKGITKRKKTPCGNIYVTINSIDDKPKEIFAKLGKSGTCARAFTEPLSKLASLALRRGASINQVKECLLGVTCKQGNAGDSLACPDALGKALEDIEKKEVKKDDEK